MSKLKWVFIGSLRNKNSDMAAYSAAGQLAQAGFIKGCINTEYEPITIYSMPLRRIFPKNNLLVIQEFSDGIYQSGYINLPLLKQVSFALNILSRVLTKHDYKFIICYNPSFALLLYGLLIQRCKKIDFIPMLYDIILPNSNTGNATLAAINYKVYKKFLKYFNKTIVISKSIIADFHIENSSIIIEGGLPQDTIVKFDTADTHTLSKSQTFKIVFAGGLEKENGLEEMIEAVKMIKSDEVHLYIYGSGPLSENMNIWIENHNNIHVMGYLEHDILIEHIKNADLLLNIRIDQKLSTKYFFPSKLIEYMYSGVPILSTDFESLPEEYKAHLYLTKEDPISISESIKNIINSSEFERRGKAIENKKWIIEEKSWNKQSNKIINWALDN